MNIKITLTGGKATDFEKATVKFEGSFAVVTEESGVVTAVPAQYVATVIATPDEGAPS